MRSTSLRRAGIALGVVLGLGLLGDGARASNVAAGSEAPNVGGEWLNHDTTTLKDLRGMAVLVEFWATWCGPCVAQIPHLNEIHEKYKDKGLVVVGVSNESKSLVEKFIADKGMKYPIAIDPPAGSAYGVQSIPHAVLVGPDGRVLWAGHPSGLKEADIEKSLEKATFIPPLPERHAKYNAVLRQRKFGKAYLDIKKATSEGKIKDEESKATLAGMEARMKTLLEGGEKAGGEGDFYTAGKHLNELKISFAGTDEAKKAADRLKDLEKDQKARDQIKAVETLEKLEVAMDSKSYPTAYQGYQGLIKKFPGTKIEEIAKEKVAMIDKEKLLNYRANCPACKKDGKTCSKHRSS